MSPQAQLSPARGRSLAARIGLRFTCLYFVLFCLTNQVIAGLVPFASEWEPSSLAPVRATVFWTARMFGIRTPLVYQGSGSGDKTFDWVLAFCILNVALFGAILWTVLDRRRTKNDAGLYKWFALFLRFALGGQLVAYGMAKFIPLQMPYPSIARLLEPYGSFSPMGVLWSSIGASPAYETFVGSAELLAGVLLFFPRTAFLGALLALADLTEVFMLNMTYDVPVKLFSFHLLLMSLVLLAPEVPRLARFFFTDRAIEPRRSVSLFRGALAAQTVFAVLVIGTNAYSAMTAWRMYGGGAPKSPLYGIWNNEKSDGYRRVIFDRPDSIGFQDRGDRIVNHRARLDIRKGTIVVDSKAIKGAFQFVRNSTDRMTLDGSLGGTDVHMRLSRVDPATLALPSRGFHWIQEYPFNR